MHRLAVLSAPPPPDDPREVPADQWNDWRWQHRDSGTTGAEIGALLRLTEDERAGLAAAPGLFRVGATPYYFSLIDRDNPHCPVRRQVIPWGHETVVRAEELVDPLGEDTHNPTPAIVHKYPD